MLLNRKLKNVQYYLVVTVFVMISVSFISNSQAQGFYILGSAGYSFGMNAKGDGYYNNNYKEVRDFQNNVFTTELTRESVPFSMGKGVSFDVLAGYKFNEFIGAEIGTSFLLGGKTEWVNEGLYDQTSSTGEKVTSVFRTNESAQSQMWRITPMIVFHGGGQGNLNPYLKFGPVLGFGSFTIDSDEYSSRTGGAGYESNTEKSRKYSGGMAFGFSGVIGVDYAINERMAIFGEVRYIGMSYSPKESKLTKYTVNGNDNLDNQNVAYKDHQYVDKLETDLTQQNPDEPSVILKKTFNMSSLGFNVGVKYNF